MGQINKGMFTSNRDDWETPQDLFNALDDMFDFDLDPCASHDNHKTERYFTEEDDGLSRKWEGRVFMNPPYGRVLGDWIQKAYEEAQKDHCDLVIGLIPSRTDTRYWHDYVMRSALVLFIKGRVHFSGSQSAPFPSAIVLWYRKHFPNAAPVIGTFDLKTMEVR